VRAWGPPWDSDGRATYFESINRNKRSIALDLGDSADQVVAQGIAARADIMLENFAPGTLERFGLGYEQVAATNPGVIYASITGFGRGAGAGRPGYDLMVQAVGGLMSITGSEPGDPTRTGVALVDVLSGLHLGLGVLAALHHREATGEGQRVEVSLLGALLSSLVNQAGGYAQAGVVPGIIGNTHPSIAPYQVYAAADRPMVLAVGNDSQFASLCRVIDRPELLQDSRFHTNSERVAHRDALNAVLVPVFASRAANDWDDVLTSAGVPCGPVNDLAEAMALAERFELSPIVEIARTDGSPSRQVANPIVLSKTPATLRLAPPALGADDETIRRILEADPT